MRHDPPPRLATRLARGRRGRRSTRRIRCTPSSRLRRRRSRCTCPVARPRSTAFDPTTNQPMPPSPSRSLVCIRVMLADLPSVSIVPVLTLTRHFDEVRIEPSEHCAAHERVPPGTARVARCLWGETTPAPNLSSPLNAVVTNERCRPSSRRSRTARSCRARTCRDGRGRRRLTREPTRMLSRASPPSQVLNRK